MIEKIAFTPQVNLQKPQTPKVNFTGNFEKQEKEDNSVLLCGSLAVLGAFGLGMIVRKPQAVKSAVNEAVEVVTKQTEETVDTLAKATNKVAKPKSKRTKRQNQNIAGKEKHIDKTDAKYHRKKQKTEITHQQQRELNEQFTEDELLNYLKENGYKKPAQKEQKAINVLHEQNAQQHAQTNTIGQNAAIITSSKPKTSTTQIETDLKSLEGSIKNLKQRINGAKRFGKDTTKLETQLKILEEKYEKIQTSVVNQAA